MRKTNQSNTGKKKNNVLVPIFLIAIIAVVLVLYYVLANQDTTGQEEEIVVSTPVSDVLLRNLDTDYPPTPKEVIIYYSELIQCFYNEEYTEEDLIKLADKARLLYDDELLAENKEEEYLFDLKEDISTFEKGDIEISSFATSASVDVEYDTMDGFEWARLNCVYSVRQSTTRTAINHVYLLRKDENSHWRIYGWKLADDGTNE
ncbi:MAG: hypothetical protein HGA25_09620 [Clostridiales bacterium]|nr:hypothetical protein [Clostridiales bacterium]